MTAVGIGDRLGVGDRHVHGGGILANHARGRGAGLFQCGFGIGFFLASLVWLFVGPAGRTHGA